MLLVDVIAYQKKRIQNPWVWVPMLVLTAVILLGAIPVLIVAMPRYWQRELVSTLIGTLSLALLYVWLSPAPWFWTGTRASHAPLVKGIVHSLVFNMGILLLTGFLQVLITWGLPDGGLSGKLFKWSGNGINFLAHSIGAGALGYFITIFERTLIVKEETEKKLREAHWVLLRGQLSPHVLFNALNGLAELVHINPVAAEKGILNLSALYRGLLDHGSRPAAPLEDERLLVERFLLVEKMRLGNRIQVEWDWDAALEKLQTPPFLVQPLVENAIKHGIAPCTTGGKLTIRLRQAQEHIVLCVANTGNPLPLVLGSGVGVSNMEARLFLAYGDRAHLRLYAQQQTTIAEVMIEREAIRESP